MLIPGYHVCDKCGERMEGDFYHVTIKNGSVKVEWGTRYELCTGCWRKISASFPEATQENEVEV